MGLSLTVSQINGDLDQKIAKFSHPHIFCAPTEGVPLGIGYRRSGVKKLEWKATGPRKKTDDIFIHLDTIHQRDT